MKLERVSAAYSALDLAGSPFPLTHPGFLRKLHDLLDSIKSTDTISVRRALKLLISPMTEINKVGILSRSSAIRCWSVERIADGERVGASVLLIVSSSFNSPENHSPSHEMQLM